MTSRSLLHPARLAGQSVLRTQSDERLTDLACEGSDSAFEAIVARYRRPLLGYCGRVLSQERAEDAVQLTFVKAYAAMTGGEVVRGLRPWLYRIAYNTSLNALRDRALQHVPLDDRLDRVERPEQVAERRHRLTELVDAVQALPARQREAILLRELEGRGYEEIADQLGVTYGAVRQLVNRARTSIRAGMTALTPFGLLARLTAPLSDLPVAARVSELCGAGGAAAAAKVCATALVSGAIAGVGPAPAEHDAQVPRTGADAGSVRRSAPARSSAPPSVPAARVRTAAGLPVKPSRPSANRPTGRRLHEFQRGRRPVRAPDAEPRQPATGARDHREQLAYREEGPGDSSQRQPAAQQMGAREAYGDRRPAADSADSSLRAPDAPSDPVGYPSH